MTRALETVADEHGVAHPGEGWTDPVVTPERGVRVVDGLLTGWHEPEASHLQLLEAVGGRPLLDRSYAAALDLGYRWHEFGDLHLSHPDPGHRTLYPPLHLPFHLHPPLSHPSNLSKSPFPSLPYSLLSPPHLIPYPTLPTPSLTTHVPPNISLPLY